MLPACYFLLTIGVRILFGWTTMYYDISPSFLQSPFPVFALHKAQLILTVYCWLYSLTLPPSSGYACSRVHRGWNWA